MQDSSIIISQHRKDKESSVKFKERRFAQWNENYALHRDKVQTNRLTQRQPINVPITREAVQTWVSKLDTPPELSFESRGNENKDKDGEILLNELWQYYYDTIGLDVIDYVEKKIVGLQGRGFKKWGFSNGKIFCDLIDPYDIEIDPRANPLDINGTADFIKHTHIYKSLRNILANKDYSDAAKLELKIFLDSSQGILRSKQDYDAYENKKERLQNLGAQNYDDFTYGDVIVELNESYKNVWHDDIKQFVRHFMVIAADTVVLLDKPMKDALGLSRIPIVTWASDPDINDIWSDGIADSVRTFNKITNMYLSQDLENRTYRNFGMYFFNTMNGQFTPQAFEPKPFGMYPVPGNPAEIVKQVDIQPLNDTSNQISWLKDLIQSSVAQTATERGEVKSDTTLGQTQLSFQQSQGRTQVVTRLYMKAWKESGEIFYELLKNNSAGTMKLFKRGSNNKMFSKDVVKSDWDFPAGYECRVVSKEEKDVASDFSLKQIQYVKNSFATNPVALRIAKRKELELLDWSKEDIDSVMQAEGNSGMPYNPVQDAPSIKNNPQDNPLQTNAASMKA